MMEISSEREVIQATEAQRISTTEQNAPMELSSTRSAGGKTMWDIGCIGASILFFAIAIGYAMGCDRLKTKEKQG